MESHEDDRLLRRIDLLDDRVGRECEVLNFSLPILRYVDERVQLIGKREPDKPSSPRGCLDAAQIAVANSDLARGRIFAKRAIEGWRIAQGNNCQEVIRCTSLALDPAGLPIYGQSLRWKTSLDEAPLSLNSSDFEDWLWRREKPKKMCRSGQLTTLRDRGIFPAFSDLPYDNWHPLGFYRGVPSTDQSSRHWCFLREITDSMTLHHLELEILDVDNERIPLHFNTDGLGSEFSKQARKGLTFAVLYAERRTFTYGNPGIKLVDPKLLQIFPVSLKKLLELSDRVYRFAAEVDGTRTCHGCGKRSTFVRKCGGWSLFGYCDNVCQRTGWVEKGHKTDCKLLKNPDLRGLFVLQ